MSVDRGSGAASGADPVVAGLCVDLRAEADDLRALLEPLPEQDWMRPTPAPGWTIHDQVAHLAHFDGVTRLALAEPEGFLAERDAVTDLQSYVDGIGPANARRTSAQMLQWWREEQDGLIAAALAAPHGERVPWFGPAMSLPSKLTARIMETWAHGQDVADALGVIRTPTDRLRHIARIGVLATPNSFRTHGHDPPSAPIRVALTPPAEGPDWVWGDPIAADVVSGTALDFCLVVTQRRHVDDTSLHVHGPAALAWIAIAQAFAGPAGRGRAPGQFG